jgi:hypothetical protein
MTQPSSWIPFNPLKWVADVAYEEQLKINEERRQKAQDESSSQASSIASSSYSLDPNGPDAMIVIEEDPISFRTSPSLPPENPPSLEADSFLQNAWENLIDLLHIPDSAKEQCTRIIPFGDQDYNPFSVDVTEESQRITQKISNQIDQIRADKLPSEIISEIPSVGPVKEPNEENLIDAILTENRQITDTELLKFQPVITAYTMFRLLDWVADNSSTQGEEKDPTIYQCMVAKVLKSRAEGAAPLSLWQIYQEEMGANLNPFSRVKAWLCYLLFYEKTNIIPSLIKALTKSTLEGFRKHLTTGETFDSVSSTALLYTLTYLNSIDKGISDYIIQKKIDTQQNSASPKPKFTSLDTYKQMALEEIFSPNDLNRLIKECSSKAIRLFFPQIPFCNLWKKHTSPLLQTLGGAISTLVNGLLNPIIKISLEKIILPFILRSAIDNFTSNTLEQEYLFTRGLYSVTAEKLKEIYENLINPKEPTSEEKKSPEDLINAKESEETSSEEIEKIDALEIVSKLLTEVLTLPHTETPLDLKKVKKTLQKNPNKVHNDIKIGIEKAGGIVLDILRKPKVIEKLFANLLEVSRDSLSTPSENFEKLKEEHKRIKKELNNTASKLFDTIVDQAVEEEIAPKYEKLEKTTKAALSQTKKETANLLSNPEELITTIEKTAAFIDNLFAEIPEPNKENLSPEKGFQAIKDFCNLLQDLNSNLLLKNIEKKHQNLSSPQKKSFDRALQPLRIKMLTLTKLLGRLNEEQNVHYLCSRALQPMRDLYTNLEKIDNLLRTEETSSLETIFHPLRGHIEEAVFFSARLNLLEPEAIEPLKKCLTKLSDSLKIVQKEGQIIDGLLSLIEQGEKNRNSPPLVDQLVHSPLSEDIKKIIENILTQANINRPPVISMIDQMGMHVFPEWRKNWNWDKFQGFILEQLEKGQEHLQQALIKKFKTWQHLPRGDHGFQADSWVIEAREFVNTIKDHKDKKSLSLLLPQIESFLRDDSIINAQWNRFCQQIRQEIETRKQRQLRAIKDYQNDSTLLQFTKDLIPKIREKQEPTYKNIKNIIQEIKSKTTDLIKAASEIKFEKSYAPTDVITAGLGLGGAVLGGFAALGVASGILPASLGAAALGGGFMGLANWFNPKKNAIGSGIQGAIAGAAGGVVLGPIAPLIAGGAGGIYLGKKALDNAKGYGQKEIAPEINKIFQNAMKELGKSYTKSTIVYAALEAFSRRAC